MSANDDLLARLGRTLDDLARSEAPELLREAHAEARSKVRALLTEAIAERLLQEADGALARPASTQHRSQAQSEPAGQPPEAPTRASRGAAAPEQTEGWGLYVYGVVAAGSELEPMPGIDGEHPLSLIATDSLAAVASRVTLSEFGEEALQDQTNDFAWLEETARRHEQILEHVGNQVTLVPMRLCTIYRSERSVQGMLEREHDYLVDALQRLAGHTELGVKVYAAAPRTLRDQDNDLGARRREGPQARAGGDYLRQRSAQLQRHADADAALEHACSEIHERLARLAVEAKLNPLQPPELSKREDQMLLNGVYLVAWDAFDEFREAVCRLSEEHGVEGLQVELTGPWPPYNFVNSSIEVGR